MREPSDDQLDYLLSRGDLSGETRHRIIQGVLASTAARPRRPRRWWALGGGAGLVMAAATALFLIWAPPRTPGPSGDFRSKGGGAQAPIVVMSCLGATIRACPRGSLIAFSLDGASQEGNQARTPAAWLLSAYADPIPTGERIWYLTNQPVVENVVPKAARIGNENLGGRYRVQVLLTRRELTRAELAAPANADIVVRGQYDLEVVR